MRSLATPEVPYSLDAEQLFELSPLSSQVLSTDGRILRVNKAWERLFGVTLEQVADYNFLQDPQLEHLGVTPLMRRAIAGETVNIPAVPFVPDRGMYQGRARWVEAVAYPVFGRDGRVREVVLVQQDITDREEIRQKLERLNERNAFLVEASIKLAESLDVARTLDEITALLVPRFADWCAVYDSTARPLVPLAVHHTDPGRIALLNSYLQQYPVDVNAPRGLARVLREGTTEHIPNIPDELLVAVTQSPEQLEMLRRLELRSYVSVPMTARGRVVGALSIASATPNRHGVEDVAFLEDLGRRAGLALDNLRLLNEAERGRRFLEAVLQQMPSGVVILDKTDSRFTANRQAEVLLGRVLPSLDAIEQVDGGLTVRRDGSPIPTGEFPVVRAAEGEFVPREDYEFEQPDGGTVILSTTAAPVLDSDGNTMASVVIFDDVTERRKLEGQVLALNADLERRVEERSREVYWRVQALEAFVALTEAIGTESDLDELGRQALSVFTTSIEGCDAARLKFLDGRWRAIDWAGQPDEQIIAALEHGLPAEVPSIRGALTAREALFSDDYSAEVDGLDERVMQRYGTAAFVPITARGEVLGIFAIGVKGAQRWDERDKAVVRAVGRAYTLAVERALLIADLASQKRELEAHNAEQESFAYTVSHDLRAPLLSIQGMSELLRGAVEAGEATEASFLLSRIENNVNRMGDLLNSILALSRIGRVVEDREALNLGAAVRNVVAITEPRLAKNRVTVELAEEWPTITFGRGELEQVITNLLTNAAKFAGRAGREPRIAISASQDGERVVLIVDDTGPGIPLESRDRAFGLFQRLDSKVEGTGVGLAIVKRIVERRGGAVRIEESPLGGARFKVTLPAAHSQ